MSSNTQRVWKVIKPHLPLIRFKKGGNVRTNVGFSSETVKTSSASNPSPVSSGPPIGSTPRGSGIEEELMPKRYRRQPMTDREMQIIESGGAL